MDDTYGCAWDWDITNKPTEQQLDELISGLIGTTHTVNYGTRTRSIDIVSVESTNSYYGLDGKFKYFARFKVKPTFIND